eukprot:909907-Rhodomonas_salina.1
MRERSQEPYKTLTFSKVESREFIEFEGIYSIIETQDGRSYLEYSVEALPLPILPIQIVQGPRPSPPNRGIPQQSYSPSVQICSPEHPELFPNHSFLNFPELFPTYSLSCSPTTQRQSHPPSPQRYSPTT